MFVSSKITRQVDLLTMERIVWDNGGNLAGLGAILQVLSSVAGHLYSFRLDRKLGIWTSSTKISLPAIFDIERVILRRELPSTSHEPSDS